MTVGIRIRDPATGAIRLDFADFTVQMFYSTTFVINGSGSLAIAGINSTNFAAFIMPAQQLGFPSYSLQISQQQNALYQVPRVYISGSSVYWIVDTGLGDTFVTGLSWQLIVMRYA